MLEGDVGTSSSSAMPAVQQMPQVSSGVQCTWRHRTSWSSWRLNGPGSYAQLVQWVESRADLMPHLQNGICHRARYCYWAIDPTYLSPGPVSTKVVPHQVPHQT